MAVLSSPSRRRKWDDGIPPLLRPLVRAYLLGYASSVAPRLLTLLVQQVPRRSPKKSSSGTAAAQNGAPFLVSLQRILQGGLDWQRFPTFCAAIVGGSTFLELPLRAAFDRLAKNSSDIARQRLSRWLAAFIAAWLSLLLLQSKQTPGFTETVAEPEEHVPGKEATQREEQRQQPTRTKTVHYAGRTLDLTLFAVTRALDVVVGELWHRRKQRRQSAGTWTRLESAVSRLADPALFALSSGLVMWAWFYSPSRLPRGYNKWISTAAAVDSRLITALQHCRSGSLRYGVDTGLAPLLGSMCADYNLPRSWGDPAVAIPFPCELVHMGVGPSCERHALSRFARSFRWALATYLPLNLLLLARRPRSLAALRRALISSARSSTFLGAFIALFYYGVCLARTRLGPRLLLPPPHTSSHSHPRSHSHSTLPPPPKPHPQPIPTPIPPPSSSSSSSSSSPEIAVRQRIDAGLCVAAGCLLCGWSILLEQGPRRKDMALFVAPRAMATLFPRRYDRSLQWRETAAFAAATAVVFTCARENPRRVRGVLGGVLGSVLGAA